MATSKAAGEKGEKEHTCKFCEWMHESPCKTEFIKWEQCHDKCLETERDNDKATLDVNVFCKSLANAVQNCMRKHPDFFGPPPD